MASLTEIVARARTIAEGRGADANSNPIIDAGMTAEALVPHAARYACERATLNDLASATRDHYIEIDSDGVGELPESIVRKYLDSSFLTEIPHSSFASWPDYNRQRFTNLLCYYTHHSSVFKSDCSTSYGELVRTIASIVKADNDYIDADSTAGASASGYLTVLANGSHATGRLTVFRKQGYSTGSLTITQGVQATGQFEVTDILVGGFDTIQIGGVNFVFSALATAGGNIQIKSIPRDQAVEIANALTAYAAANPASNVAKATYTTDGTFVNITNILYGTVGNTLTISTGASLHISTAAATLLGGVNGVQTGEIIYVNGIKCIWSIGTSSFREIYLGLPSDSASVNASQFQAILSASTLNALNVATYSLTTSSADPDFASPPRRVISITYAEQGAVGNLFTTPNSNLGAITGAAATLTGGVGGFVEGEKYTLNGKQFTFSNFNTGAYFIPFTNDATVDTQTIVDKWNNSADTAVDDATYSVVDPITQGDDGDPGILIVFDAPGAGGNAFTTGLASTVGGIVASGANLVHGGGAGVSEGSTINIGGAVFTYTNINAGIPGYRIDFNAADPEQTVVNMANTLNASTDPLVTVAQYIPAGVAGESLLIRYKTHGNVGNTFPLFNSSDGSVIRSASSLLGGYGDEGTGGFTGLADVGRRIVAFENSAETVHAFIEEVITGDRVRVRDYYTGSSSTEVTGSAKIYETRLEFIRTGTCTKDYGDPLVTDLTNLANTGETGYLLLVYSGSTVIMRAMITSADGGFFTVAGWDEIGFATAKTFNLYRILAPTIILNAVSVPTIPTDPADTIEMSDKLTDDTILTLAGALTGEIPIAELLGSQTPQGAKSE